MDSFEAVWQTYPRKVAKFAAQQQWNRMSADEQFKAAQALPIHIRYWKIAGWAFDYIPHLRTWLCQKRWADELEMPEASGGNDWMKTTAGIAAKAKEVGITPRAGEDWHSLKARILGQMKAA